MIQDNHNKGAALSRCILIFKTQGSRKKAMQLAVYQKNYEDCQEQLDKTARSCSKIIFWRGIASAAAIILFCAGYSQKNPYFYLCSAAALAVFLLLVRFHSQLKTKQNALADRQSVIKDYIARFSDDWKNFPLNGEKYLRNDLTEAADLDIFGKSSLYQYICTASTIQGQDQLALWLSQPSKDPAQIKERQKAAAELAEKTGFRADFETAARSLRNLPCKDIKHALDDLSCPSDRNSRHQYARKTAVRLLPAITLVFLFFTVLGIYRQHALPCFLCFTSLQLLLCLGGYHRNHRLLAPIYKLNQSVTPYRRLLQALEQETFQSPFLNSLQKELTRNKSASEALKELESITDSVIMRKNLFAFILCNSLFLHDYRCVERYLKWKENYQNEVKSWLLAAGTTEALISLGVIFHTRQTHTMPRIETPSYPELSADEIKHPLIKETDAIGNDFEIEHHTCIITGSNMSGKTTFMRSIGVNLILAYAGGFCTAKRLAVSPMELCTSMRVQDDVAEGISTFYAELLRIKKMISVSKQQIPMISLIDEIYKGTNSSDRIFAAKETIKKLSKPYAVTIITTHDFELCDLEKDAETDTENYHFAEHYEQDRILFDYKIKKGRCTTANARYLLRMAGIL